jgi:hypothetical protein
MTVYFVDVSHHDRDRRGAPLDWRAITATTGQGEVMCARASYGDPNVFAPPTRHFAEFMAGAAAAGYSCRGGYHNLIRGDAASIARQVDHFRRQLDLHGTEWAMADIEPYDELRDNGLWPRWSDVLRWRDRWAAVESRVMAWYIGEWVWEGWLGSPDLRELPGPLIAARYPGGDGTPQQIYAAAGGATGLGWRVYVDPDGRRGGRDPDVWQFTAAANVAGASGNTDCNAVRGTLTQLTALLQGGDDMLTADALLAALKDSRVRREIALAVHGYKGTRDNQPVTVDAYNLLTGMGEGVLEERIRGIVREELRAAYATHPDVDVVRGAVRGELDALVARVLVAIQKQLDELDQAPVGATD